MSFLKKLFGEKKKAREFALYAMTFTPHPIPQSELAGFTRMFAERIAEKNNLFKLTLMTLQSLNYPVHISAQLYSPLMHTRLR